MIDEAAMGQLSSAISRWDEGTWCLAALAIGTGVGGAGAGARADAGTGGADGALAEAAREVLAAAGLGPALVAPGELPFSPAQLAGMASSPLLQTAALVSGPHEGWAGQSEAALAAQGQASGAAAAMFARFALPHLGDLAVRLATPGARMLDVGTGIGALAIGYAQAFPELHVIGLDVMPRVLDLARARVAASPVADRVDLRLQDVADLTDEACYDLAWLPAPFVPEPAFSAGLSRIVAALRPGGLLMIGHGRFDGTELENALTRFKTVVYGGTALDGPTAVKLLERHGLTSVQTVPTPPGAPALTFGLRKGSSFDL